MKTIAIFHPTADLYGSDRMLVEVLKVFPKEWRKVVYLRSGGELEGLIQRNVLNVHVVKASYMPIIYRKMFNPIGICRFLVFYIVFSLAFMRDHFKFRYSFFYLNTLSVSLILPFLKLFKAPKIIHVHEIISSPRVVAYLTSFMCKFSSKVICVSCAVKSNLLKGVKTLENKLIVVHNGITPLRNAGNVVEKEEGVMCFYLFGRIMEKKGHLFLINSLKLLPIECLNKLKVFIVGSTLKDGSEFMARLEAEVQKNGLSDHVKFLGFYKDVSIPLRNADVCLVPSLMADPFPTTILEAFSASKPVIATNNGGAVEIVEDGVNGYLVAPGDTEALASRIANLIYNPELIAELGHNANHTYFEGYTKEKFSLRLSTVIRTHFSRI